MDGGGGYRILCKNGGVMADQVKSEVAQKFAGLPMSDLIAAPLTAVCESQMKLAQASYEYMMKIGFEDGVDGKAGRTRLVEFDLERPAETVSGYQSVKTHVQAPFLGLVPIPSLLVEDATIEFQMEVSATESQKSTTTTEGKTETTAKYGFFGLGGNVTVSGSVTSARENTRTTNQSAKYQVRVYAHQQQPTEGMARLMDILASCTAALPGSPDGAS